MTSIRRWTIVVHLFAAAFWLCYVVAYFRILTREEAPFRPHIVAVKNQPGIVGDLLNGVAMLWNAAIEPASKEKDQR